MKIKSNASPDEVSSPFFDSNKQFCYDIEKYLANKSGKVKGTYNAWSYQVYGKFNNPDNWDIYYKKSTFSNSGNLLLSSKYQSLLEFVEWETDKFSENISNFSIRKRKFTDFLKLLFSKSLLKLEFEKKYILHFKKSKPSFLGKLLANLEELFNSGEVYKIIFINGKLKIELRSNKHHFEVLENLIEM